SRFITQKLKLQNHYNYFNAGILVYNIKKCLEINFEKRCLDKLLELKNPPTADQDILNAALENEIHFISPSWNCMQNHTGIDNQQYINSIPNVHMHDYIASQKDPYIIHYIGSSKPWNSPHLPKADIWWCYARQTPFYEEILFKNIKYFTFKNLPSNHINSIYVKPCGAVEKIKSHLSYKLGNEILSVKENKIKMFILPFTLFFIFIKHKFSILILNLISDVNPNLKPLNLEEYQDYQQALQVKNYLSYRLGNALVKHPFAFIFRANKVYKDWKREKGRG
ncbi:glycosyltransferase family 8 protein, partial [Campylobacter coli]